MTQLTIQTDSKQYDVYIGEGVRSKISCVLKDQNYSSVFIIADEFVFELHGQKLVREIPANIPFHICKVPQGEQAKSFAVYEETISAALTAKLDRQAVILAFGGGAIGDLAGFVASTYMRGIAFIGIPTTILAHDSAVGGKVAINHELGKNMVGHFYQPSAVIYDLSFLVTLSEREVRSGLAEVIKHSLIADPFFYRQLLSKKSLQEFKGDFLEEVLLKGIEIKNHIVSQDEREQGIRAYLNFGHTFGHAIEKQGNYSSINHGEAVMFGMMFALHLSKSKLDLSIDLQEFHQWIEKLGYSLKIPNYPFDSLFSTMKLDKKAEKGHPRFVLLKEIGSPSVYNIHKNQLEETFENIKSSIKGE
ncbi:3-dehydroquinate synthase [Bacillus sp. 2205SS5-2]|uniref:3-dehydroquinate synthase n=1 Tax=Bacillus sp. 2205SS5-2 TaxID=3109031 RepID=UPI00300569A3